MRIPGIIISAFSILLAFYPVGELESQESHYEIIILQTDRSRYIAGEEIWFSAFTIHAITGRLSGRSQVAYAELFNSYNTPIVRSRIRLDGGRGSGCFLIPDTVSSGTFTIRAYTYPMRSNLPGDGFISDISVINPFSDSRFRNKQQENPEPASPGPFNSSFRFMPVSVLSDSVFGRRERAVLRLVPGKEGDEYRGMLSMSISVSLSEAGAVPATAYIKQQAGDNNLDTSKKITRHLFESDGHYLSVKVRYRNGTGDSCRNVFMSVQGKVAQFDYARPDPSGSFTFLLQADDRIRNLIIQPEYAKSSMVLEVESPFSSIVPSYRPVILLPADSLPDIFAALSFNNQVSRIYGISRYDEMPDSRPDSAKVRRFYGIPEIEVILDDYIKLPTMEEVFFELLPGVILRPSKSGYELLITNPTTGVFYNDPPLVMIDGVIINDLNVVAGLNPEIVERIEVIKTPYLFGELVLHGIVNIITRSGDFRDVEVPEYAAIIPYRSVDLNKHFREASYTDERVKASRIPDLRNTLYWNPDVKSASNGEATAEFWTSDQPGRYTVVISGVSESGELISSVHHFRVR